MDTKEAEAGLQSMEAARRRRLSTLNLSALLMGASMGASMGVPMGSNLGLCRGQCRKPKNLNNDPERAKGMKPFEFNGTTVYAGTLKAARKKYALLLRNQ